MDNQPPKKSKKLWWVLGGIALVVTAIAGGSNSNTQAPSAMVSPSAQTADVAQQIAQPVTPSVQPIAQPQSQQTELSNDNYYTNSDGNTVHSPAYSNSGAPAGATAQCGDGTYSFSQHRSGTCSHHGGVITWL